LIRIPVEYGGAAGRDLEEVARIVGLSPEEVVRRHAGTDYRVAFLGFLAGFPYLSGLPPELAVPRLPNPRTQVPAGSVALAGQQTGIYPVAAPGGWRLIGRAAMQLFDSQRTPPSLLRPGDRVRFVPLRAAGASGSEQSSNAMTVDRTGKSLPATHHRGGTVAMEGSDPAMVPWLRVRASGPLTTVQDLGRIGYARYGVSASGAADADALRMGNLLLGNADGAAALELTLGGGEFEALAPCAVVVTGADCAISRNGSEVASRTVLSLAAGDELSIGTPRQGVRCYLCVLGGVCVAPVLGSRATDVRAGFGGFDGRALRAGDVLWRGATGQAGEPGIGRTAPADPLRTQAVPDAPRVRIVAGPQAKEAAADLEALRDGAFIVSPRSDRVGVRLQADNTSATRHLTGGETISEGVPRGAVQVPPNGERIILLAEHQTTGGYRVPAVVASADLWRVAQLRPGDSVYFTLASVEDAVAALRERDAWLRRLASVEEYASQSTAGQHDAPDSALLVRGFAEWGAEEEPDGE
jgi:biotin-dependent carboxylase-like uncharacterized protein